MGKLITVSLLSRRRKGYGPAQLGNPMGSTKSGYSLENRKCGSDVKGRTSPGLSDDFPGPRRNELDECPKLQLHCQLPALRATFDRRSPQAVVCMGLIWRLSKTQIPGLQF